MINAAALFSSAGICEYYLKNTGVNVVVANELIESRAQAHKEIYPDCTMINADITDTNTQHLLIEECKNNNVNMIIITPPCQGVSSAGSNKTESSIFDDPRNYLVLSALNVVDAINPDYFIIENVPRFQQMHFLYEDELVSIEELLNIKYGKDYNVDGTVFDSADYGIPQTRYRIVFRVWKKNLHWSLPEKKNQVTLEEAIGNLPSLEPGETSDIKNHYARKHPQNHIECMRHTKTGMSAFKNNKFFPQKPDGSRIKGYGNSYKRMRWDKPAPTITMRNEIISSQENVHPGRWIKDDMWSDARVLTLRELLIVSSLPPDMDKPSRLSETAFRQLIGEGIPPLMLEEIIKGIA